VRRNVTVDWAEREDVRAHLRRLVKRVLRKHGYPPDKQEKATQTVLEQAALLSAEVGNGMRGASNNGMQRTASRRRRTGAFATSDTSTQSKVQNQITPVNPVVKHCVRFCAWTQSDCTESAGR
jgi:type I restriction enzyme R subunit